MKKDFHAGLQDATGLESISPKMIFIRRASWEERAMSHDQIASRSKIQGAQNPDRQKTHRPSRICDKIIVEDHVLLLSYVLERLKKHCYPPASMTIIISHKTSVVKLQTNSAHAACS